MVYQEIVRYLEEGKRRGFSIELLKSKLLEGGFQEQDVNEAISVVNGGQSSQEMGPLNKQDFFMMPPKEQQMPVGQAQQMRQPLGQQTTFDKPESLMRKQNEVMENTKQFQGIQQKEEFGVNTQEKKQSISRGEGKWMKVGAILSGFMLFLLLLVAVLAFTSPDFLRDLIQNGLSLLIIAVIAVLLVCLYTYAFIRVGKITGQKFLVLGSWFTIISVIMYVVLGVVAAFFVYEQAINFFSGTDSDGPYKIMFLVLAIFWVVSLMLHVIGMILNAVGLMKLDFSLKMLKISGIINMIVFFCGLGFLAGIIIFIYTILNAFSMPGTGYDGIESIMATSSVAVYSLIALFAVKAVALVFEAIGLLKASAKFE